MNRRQLWWGACVTLVMLVNVVGVLLIRHELSKRSTLAGEARRYEKLQQEQTHRVSVWLSGEAIPLADVDRWAEAMWRTTADDCVDLPSGVRFVRHEAIDVHVDQALHDAVVGLVRVYTDNSPEELIAYMKDHSEAIAKKEVLVFVKLVAKLRGVQKQQLEDMSPEELLLAYWRETHTRSRWWALVPGSCCYVYWRSDRLPGEELRQSLGTSESKVFQNVARFGHSFEPIAAMDHVLSDDGSILFADVEVLILLDAEVQNEPVPYFLRFWYEASSGLWHPYQFARVAAAGNATLRGKSTHVF